MRGRILKYAVTIKEYGRDLKRHGSLHLRGNKNIWYVFPYRKYPAALEDDEDSNRIRLFWRFMDGERKTYPLFYVLFHRAIRQLLWITKWMGDVEIVSVPRSDPNVDNPVAEICSAIVREESFLLANLIDGSDLIRRKIPILPVHRGGKYTVEEMAGTMELTRPLKAGKVLLVDDMVFRGTTIAACRRILKNAGAKKVYALCLYGYKRPK